MKIDNIRINRYLALCGFGSRRAVEDLIKAGSVRINEAVITDLSYRIKEKDNVKIKGRLCRLPVDFTYLLFNKPKGCLCTLSDQAGRPLVYDWIPGKYRHLSYVGRLDYNTRGLLLFTNDGKSARKLLHPDSGIPRVYRVKTTTRFSELDKQKLEQGLEIERGLKTRPAKVKIRANCVEITLKEGKNREIRKIMQILGYTIKDLKRIFLGNLKLGSLKEGEFRILSAREIGWLHGR
jgi:23S rRNA pseudouridine2605 synthase